VLSIPVNIEVVLSAGKKLWQLFLGYWMGHDDKLSAGGFSSYIFYLSWNRTI